MFVPFPEHFTYVCGIEDMTIQLTPRSSVSKGLAITEITEKGFLIEELFSGKGNYGVFWEAKGVRKGFEDYQVVRQKAQLQAAPISPFLHNK